MAAGVPTKGHLRQVTHTATETTPQNKFITADGGRNGSVGSAWARCPQRRGFDPPLGTFSGRGDFSLGVNMGSNSIPPKNSFG